MTFTLPDLTRVHTLEFFRVEAGGDLNGALGGPTIRINRLGDKTGVNVTLSAQGLICGGRTWIGKLHKAKFEAVRLKLPVPSDIGNPGTPLVNGAGQTGTSLVLDGLTVAYAIKAGMKFSVIVSSRRYLHVVTDDVTANGSGQATVTFAPMLRVSPADNATVEFAQPYIEGYVKQEAWSEDWTQITGELAFTLTEAR